LNRTPTSARSLRSFFRAPHYNRALALLARHATLPWGSLRESCARAAAGFLFPTRCLACDRRPVERLFRGGVCEECWSALPGLAPTRCNRCDEALAALAVETCGRCQIDPPLFLSLSAAAPYVGSAREILLAFKFRGADFLAGRLAAVMRERLGPVGRAGTVVAAPARQASAGGYRPAHLLAAEVAVRLALPFAPRGLEKTRPTARQSGLALAGRGKNVRGAFRAAAIYGDVLLVDDVATSGATARECARVLRKAGASSVRVWCFARASRIDIDEERRADSAPLR
jgi:predicted amidophosphoribosyltransferase